jgi:hypothetical protein
VFDGLYNNYFFKWWFYASMAARKCFLSNDEYRNNATMKEHDRQKEMRQKQTLNATVETANQSQWKDFKDKVTKIQDRLRIVSFAIQAIPTGVAMSREITKITDNQTAIIDEINTAPYSIIAVLPSQVQFVDDLQMTARLITGIILSYGAINQMEKSERKILLDYALGEVKTLSRNSTHMLLKIRDIKAKYYAIKELSSTMSTEINKWWKVS